jgi:hypothetical protein
MWHQASNSNFELLDMSTTPNKLNVSPFSLHAVIERKRKASKIMVKQIGAPCVRSAVILESF